MSKTADLVLREVDAGVAVISFNRPHKHNAINDAMSAEWRAAVGWAIEAPDIRCILLRGEGPSFSSGRDTNELGRRAQGESDHEFVKAAQDFGLRLLDCPKPVVAALRGHVVGGALEAALRADIRIAAADILMRLPEIRFGLVPDTGGTQLVTMLAGPARAKQMIMTGEPIAAGTALAWGLVNEVVAPDRLDGRARELAVALAAGPPLALRLAKQLIDQLWTDGVRRGTRAELAAQAVLFASPDHAEAKKAAAEGRDPTFEGR